jgi:thiol-disulfide isomerase/thioredoxin
MLRFVGALLALLAVAPAARPGDKTQAATPAEQLKALVAEYEAARQAFLKEYEPAREAYLKAANDDVSRKTSLDQLNKAREVANQRAEKCAAGCLELAEKHPDDPAALDALIWVLRHTATGGPALPEKARLVRLHGQALSLLRRDHLGSEKLGAVCRLPGMGIIADPESVKFVEEVLAKSPHRAVRAQALERLADYKLSYDSGLLRTLRKDPEQAKRLEQVWGKEVLQAALATDPERMRQEGERLYERLAKEYADIPDPQVGTLGKRAALTLAALRQPPAVGQPAPEIEGADLDSKKFKLSDYRGKVVLLTFTGDWCAACQAFHPQQRSLEEKLAGKPFALVDVNSDLILERRKKINAKDNITWRAFQETDEKGTLGPITTRWGIDQWPTLFLIDHHGVIRQKYVGSPGEKVLAEELDKLARKAEGGKK